MCDAIILNSLFQQYKNKYGNLLILISGASGAGKSHWAKRLSKVLGLKYIEQDDFYRSPLLMPNFTYSNGQSMPNWDCLDAIDIKKQNETINKHIANGVIFSGFACRESVFEHKVNFHLHLKISPETCIARRQEQHKDPSEMGAMIVKELVYPFYLETLKLSKINVIIDANEKTEKIGELLIRHMMIMMMMIVEEPEPVSN